MSERILVNRSDMKAFYGIPQDMGAKYVRMRGFTEISESKNPKEYTRQYVDEQFETTDVVGYSPSLSFGFDKYKGDEVLEDLASIIDNELTGTEAQREIIMVDFSSPVAEGGFAAKKRTFSIIGDNVGSGHDALVYSGTMRTAGDTINGVATIAEPEKGNSETVEVITFTEQ